MTAAPRQPLTSDADIAAENLAFLAKAGLLDGARAHFRAQCDRAVPEIDRALAAGDAATARRLAHGLRGAAGMLGETAIADGASAIERCVERGEPARVDALRAAVLTLGEVTP